jgi:hypothetical protein
LTLTLTLAQPVPRLITPTITLHLQVTGLVGKILELMKALPDRPSPDAAAATLNVIGNLCRATVSSVARAGTEAGSGELQRRLSEVGSGSGEGGSGSGDAPRSKQSLQFETLRAVRDDIDPYASPTLP